jgi:methylisocitrate lyase
VPEMQTRARLYELLDYAGYSAFDEDVFTFTLEGNRGGV